jgi:hypothetical protein
MNSEWFIWCLTKDERKARKLLDRVVDKLSRAPGNVAIHPDEDIPGFEVRFDITLRSSSWNDSIIELIDLGYEVADSWIILPGWSGRSIYESAESFSDECRVSGVRRIQWHIDSPDIAGND